MSLVKINWHPDCRDLRKFGLTVLLGFLILGGIVFFKKPAAACWLWAVGAVCGGIGLTGRKVSLPFYWAWMGIAFVMGNVMSRVLMFLIYAGVVTPLAVLIKILKRDRLSLRRSASGSYWSDIQPHRPGRENYERQF
jgi:hypothetical protein